MRLAQSQGSAERLRYFNQRVIYFGWVSTADLVVGGSRDVPRVATPPSRHKINILLLLNYHGLRFQRRIWEGKLIMNFHFKSVPQETSGFA